MGSYKFANVKLSGVRSKEVAAARDIHAAAGATVSSGGRELAARMASGSMRQSALRVGPPGDLFGFPPAPLRLGGAE
jgi:hypothetical protein